MRTWTRAAAAVALSVSLTAFAQNEGQIKANIAKLQPKDYPTQPIEFTVVYPPGGGMDNNARILAKYFEKWSGKKVLVNNRTGGAGMVGHNYLATQAKGDGYTLGVLASLVFADSLLRSQGKWSYSDFEPIAYLNNDPLNWIVNAEGPFKDKTLKEIVQIAKDKPGTVRVGVVPGSFYEYLVDDVEHATGAKFLRVPFQGGGPGVTALLGNNVDLTASFFTEFRSFADAGKVKSAGVAGPQRLADLPKVPTFNEALGANNISWRVERFVVSPKGLAADRKAYLAEVLNAAIRDPELQAEFGKLGISVDTSMKTPQEVTAYVEGLGRKEREFYVKNGIMK